MTRSSLSRRRLLQMAALGVAGVSTSGWMEQLARGARNSVGGDRRNRSCILLWMNGGPSQMETFDPKVGHKNGGPVQAIKTAVPGIQIGEHLPQVAERMKDMAIIRSMSTKEADHSRGAYLMRTGRPPGGPIHYPVIGSFLSKELASADASLPGFVSIGPYRFLSPAAYGPGFLGPNFAPLIVGENQALTPQPNQTYDASGLKVQNLEVPQGVAEERALARLDLLRDADREFASVRPDAPVQSRLAAYERAVKMMQSDAASAFDLDNEPASLRDAYGRNAFGQGCLLARRLVERGVPFVEVTLSRVAGVQALGWDTHSNNFDGVKRLSSVLDPAWATLMNDLHDRGLLDSTMIVWMGEFGRTPKINTRKGRDHWSRSWSTVLAGGGIAGGQVIGRTSADGTAVEDRPVNTPDFLATIAQGLGVDFTKENISNVGRPIRIAEPDAKPIKEALS